jgi:hypothetical protein
VLVLKVLIMRAQDVALHITFAPEAAYVTLATIEGAEEEIGGVEVVCFLFVKCEFNFAGELYIVAFNVAADVSLSLVQT